MYRQAVRRLLGQVSETEEFYRAGIVAIDVPESDPFTGDRAGDEDEIIGTKENTDESPYQWAPVRLIGNTVRIGRFERLLAVPNGEPRCGPH